MFHSHDPHCRYQHDDSWNMPIESNFSQNCKSSMSHSRSLTASLLKSYPCPKRKGYRIHVSFWSTKKDSSHPKKHVAKRKCQQKCFHHRHHHHHPIPPSLKYDALFANANRISCRLKCANLRFSFGIVLRQKSATSQRVGSLNGGQCINKGCHGYRHTGVPYVYLYIYIYIYIYLCAYCT